MLWSLSGFYIPYRMANTHMVTGGGLRPRLDSALVAKWPDPLDISTDIFIPGKTAAFRAQLIAALQSRDLWSAISTTDPTLESIRAHNPQAVQEEVTDALQACLAYRQYQKTTLGPSWSSGPYNPYRHLIPHMITRVERKQSSAHEGRLTL